MKGEIWLRVPCCGFCMREVAEALKKVRIDKWLWAVRLFKTRSDATEACKGGRVRIGEERVKPSRSVKLGELVQVQKDDILCEARVLAFVGKRVGAKLVAEYMEDLTPPERLQQKREIYAQTVLRRDRGSGRPTKRERREIDQLFGE